jgi:hypothetical protein
MSRRLLPAAVTAVALALSACSNYEDQLARAEHHYQNARYEAALANLEDLEFHVPGMSRSERVRYDVVRGMTHLRLDQRSDARYWLALAREEATHEPGALTQSARTTVEHTINELDPLGPAPTAGDGGP